MTEVYISYVMDGDMPIFDGVTPTLAGAKALTHKKLNVGNEDRPETLTWTDLPDGEGANCDYDNGQYLVECRIRQVEMVTEPGTIPILGHVFREMENLEWVTFAGAEPGTLICTNVDNCILFKKPGRESIREMRLDSEGRISEWEWSPTEVNTEPGFDR